MLYLRAIFDLIVQVKRELFSFFAFFLFSKESGGSPQTLRPNFNCKKGNVTADKPPVRPAGGFLLVRIYGDSFLCNLRVIHYRIMQG